MIAPQQQQVLLQLVKSNAKNSFVPQSVRLWSFADRCYSLSSVDCPQPNSLGDETSMNSETPSINYGLDNLCQVHIRFSSVFDFSESSSHKRN